MCFLDITKPLELILRNAFFLLALQKLKTVFHRICNEKSPSDKNPKSNPHPVLSLNFGYFYASASAAFCSLPAFSGTGIAQTSLSELILRYPKRGFHSFDESSQTSFSFFCVFRPFFRRNSSHLVRGFGFGHCQ